MLNMEREQQASLLRSSSSSKVKRNCLQCNVVMYVYPCHIKEGRRKFCSRKCSGESARNKVKKICVVCNTGFDAHPSDIKLGRWKCCSNACRAKYKQNEPVQFFFKNISHQKHEGGCWIWEGSVCGKYGFIGVRSCKTKPHRYSYILHHGEIGDGLKVCHKCDNPLCCNPEHLFLGTSMENSRDMVSKGRSASGERNASAVLTKDQVLDIRRRAFNNESGASIARHYSVGTTTVYDIIHRRRWKNI